MLETNRPAERYSHLYECTLTRFTLEIVVRVPGKAHVSAYLFIQWRKWTRISDSLGLATLHINYLVVRAAGAKIVIRDS